MLKRWTQNWGLQREEREMGCGGGWKSIAYCVHIGTNFLHKVHVVQKKRMGLLVFSRKKIASAVWGNNILKKLNLQRMSLWVAVSVQYVVTNAVCGGGKTLLGQYRSVGDSTQCGVISYNPPTMPDSMSASYLELQQTEVWRSVGNIGTSSGFWIPVLFH